MGQETKLEYWLFQLSEDEYTEAVRSSTPGGPLLRFSIDHYADRITLSDIGFIWVTNVVGKSEEANASLVGWGVVTTREGPAPSTASDFNVRVTVPFGTGIPREEVRTVPELFDL